MAAFFYFAIEHIFFYQIVTSKFHTKLRKCRDEHLVCIVKTTDTTFFKFLHIRFHFVWMQVIMWRRKEARMKKKSSIIVSHIFECRRRRRRRRRRRTITLFRYRKIICFLNLFFKHFINH